MHRAALQKIPLEAPGKSEKSANAIRPPWDGSVTGSWELGSLRVRECTDSKAFWHTSFPGFGRLH